MYKFKNELKWYVDDNYLELFHPIDNCIIKITYPSIAKLWGLMLKSSLIGDVLSNLDSQDEIRFIKSLYKSLYKRNYLLLENEELFFE